MTQSVTLKELLLKFLQFIFIKKINSIKYLIHNIINTPRIIVIEGKLRKLHINWTEARLCNRKRLKPKSFTKIRTGNWWVIWNADAQLHWYVQCIHDWHGTSCYMSSSPSYKFCLGRDVHSDLWITSSTWNQEINTIHTVQLDLTLETMPSFCYLNLHVRTTQTWSMSHSLQLFIILSYALHYRLMFPSCTAPK